MADRLVRVEDGSIKSLAVRRDKRQWVRGAAAASASCRSTDVDIERRERRR